MILIYCYMEREKYSFDPYQPPTILSTSTHYRPFHVLKQLLRNMRATFHSPLHIITNILSVCIQ